jgi:hypothetical protein
MKSDKYIELLNNNGFSDREHLEDFTYVIPYVYYALRKRGSIHEYVSLVYYDGKFCESVYELFMNKKTIHKKGASNYLESMKRGQVMVLGGLSRSLSELSMYVTKTESEVKEIVDRMIKLLSK